MRKPRVVRTKIAEDTIMITVRGRSRNHAEIDAFTSELVKLLEDADRRAMENPDIDLDEEPVD